MQQHHYLCSFCNNMFEAEADSVDRTREIRCTACTRATPDPYDEAGLNLRLRTITT
jgi:DNA-directed RNA polymerase subunit RPC12/RpoP